MKPRPWLQGSVLVLILVAIIGVGAVMTLTERVPAGFAHSPDAGFLALATDAPVTGGGAPRGGATGGAARHVGLGATVRAWTAAHGGSPAFTAESDVGGHVVRYVMYLPDGTGIAAARAAALAQLPADARVVRFTPRGVCARLVVRSATLARAFAAPPLRDAGGLAFAEFDTVLANGVVSFDGRSVNEVLFALGDPATSAPC